jgi:HK97 family phage portal protein
LPPLLVTPSAGMARHEWLHAVMMSLLLRGNAYGIITGRYANTLLPSQVDIVDPDRMAVRVTTDGLIEYRLSGVEQDPNDVWHVRAYVMPGGIEGLSPLRYAAQAIGLGLAAEQFGAQFFGDGHIPAGILQSEKDLTPKKAQEVRELWDEARQNNRRIAVLGSGASFKQISVAPEESQFLATLKANSATIARFFGVPPQLVGIDETTSHTYSSPEQLSLVLLTYTVGAWLVRLETAISTLLPRNQFVKLKPAGLLRSTTLERYQAYAQALGSSKQTGWLTVDEVRALEDLPPLADLGGGLA